MSRIVGSLPVRLDAKSLWPLVITGPTGFLLLAVRLQPIHYFLVLNACVISFLAFGKRLQNVRARSFLKKSLLIITCLAMLSLILIPTRAALITEYSVPADVRPFGIAIDTSNRVWFTEQLGNRIGYLSGTQVVEYNLPTPGAEPWGIVYDPNPNNDDPNANSIWFTESTTGKIGRFKDNVFAEFTLAFEFVTFGTWCRKPKRNNIRLQCH